MSASRAGPGPGSASCALTRAQNIRETSASPAWSGPDSPRASTAASAILARLAPTAARSTDAGSVTKSRRGVPGVRPAAAVSTARYASSSGSGPPSGRAATIRWNRSKVKSFVPAARGSARHMWSSAAAPRSSMA